MLRQAARQLLRQQPGGATAAGTALRALSTSGPVMQEVANSKEEFLARFAEVAPSMLNAPHFASDFLPKVAEAAPATGIPEKLTLNFYKPYDVEFQKTPVDLVLVPAVTGDFGVMPGHVPTVAQLRPGVVTVHKELDKSVDKYFVSSGFAFVHDDSTADLCAVEAVKVEDLDPEAVRAGLAEYTAKLASSQSKGDDYETAAAQIGVEVYSAMSAALGL